MILILNFFSARVFKNEYLELDGVLNLISLLILPSPPITVLKQVH